MIQTIEELSMNAWPAAQTVLSGGWVLRFSGGYTRRANCVTALYSTRQDSDAFHADPSYVSAKIHACETLYRAQGLPVVFKLPGKQESAELDRLLGDEGYTAEAETSVQILDLGQWKDAETPEITLEYSAGETWHADFSRLSGLAEKNHAAHRQIVGSILTQTCFARVTANDQVTACGLGVIQDSYLGIFDIVTGTEFRRQGYGEQIMCDLLGWAQRQGAHTAYLQVMLNNPPALALYAKLGFQEAYQYWYRVKR
ncbi:MAG: GNAT family N-acetyltransferase [Anaerolineaceae bacterium]|nr:GNAT family N-acetyltransferase [Anaerolineaceae bacterium]